MIKQRVYSSGATEEKIDDLRELQGRVEENTHLHIQGDHSDEQRRGVRHIIQ